MEAAHSHAGLETAHLQGCVGRSTSITLFPLQVLHEELELPGSNVKLRYLSSRTAGYKSLLKVTMTQSTVPLNLIRVHLMVAVEGHLFQKSFQASPNLAYTFIWDKTDAYGQRVYGLSDAVGMCWSQPLCILGFCCVSMYSERSSSKERHSGQ